MQIALAITGMMVAVAMLLLCAWASIEYSSGNDPLSFLHGATVQIVGESSFYGQAPDASGADVANDADAGAPPSEPDYYKPEYTSVPSAISESER